VKNATNVNHVSHGSTINATKGTYWGDDWHVYHIFWNQSNFQFLVDDVSYFSIDLNSDVALNSFNDPSNPFFFVINFAVGGNFPHIVPSDSSFPAALFVDWVRVYQNEDQVAYQAKHVKPNEWNKEEENKQNEKNTVWPEGSLNQE